MRYVFIIIGVGMELCHRCLPFSGLKTRRISNVPIFDNTEKEFCSHRAMINITIRFILFCDEFRVGKLKGIMRLPAQVCTAPLQI